ncbi:MAG TPA: ABC transporter substrate-binding protein, partial [Chloroflexota bacterium]|nr:ABC transporter substrate-binding protein [Chloroflexota bacterium]
IPTIASTAMSLPATPTTVPSVTPTPAATATVAAYPVTVTDDDKRKVTFDAPPQRIVSLSPGLTETVYALGAGDRVIVTDQFSDFPAENKPKAKLNTYPKPNVEELISLKPDLILVLVEGDDFVQQMDARGIKVLRVFPKTYDGTLQDIVWLGKVLGASTKATQIAADMRERADAVVAKTKNAPKVSVYYEIDASDPTKPWVAGPDGFFGNLVPLAGGKNIFDDLATSAGQVSAEQIVSRNPDVIILADTTSPSNAQTPAMVKARPGWSGISAVKNNRIQILDDALLTRPGPRLIDGLEQMARLLHPELFT